MSLEPVTLEGRLVRLEPLRRDHHAALCAVGLDPGIWRFTAGHVDTPEEMRDYIERALARQAEGTALPFAIVRRDAGEVVGSTRFEAFAPEHRRVEIGWTWIAGPARRTGVNVEAKYLMLRHAFETLGLNRVELKTDAKNAASRSAILALGAREEGTLRGHIVTSRGRVRDTVYYGVVADEWPAVRAALEARIGRIGARPGPATPISLAATGWAALGHPWRELVRSCFHTAYGGIGEEYAGIDGVEAKIAAMSAYPGDLPAVAATAEGRLVGLLVGRLAAGRLVIYDIFVDPARRRRGIGRELVERAARATGAAEIAAEVNRGNAPSRALFEALGFRPALSCDWLVLRGPAG